MLGKLGSFPQQPYKVRTIIIPIVCLGKLRLRVVSGTGIKKWLQPPLMNINCGFVFS